MSSSATDASAQSSRFHVGMTCEGCVGAVSRILGRFPGAAVNIDLQGKSVSVVHGCAADAAAAERAAMLAALQKWGAAGNKEVSLLA